MSSAHRARGHRGFARALTAAFVLGSGLPACSSGSACGPSSGVVARVIDGDTIELEGGQRIRYMLVNTPETTSGKNECYGAQAVTFNTDLVAGKTVQLQYDENACTDNFNRLLAYVSIDGRDVNLSLVERGYACVLHIPPGGDDRADEFKSAQAQAKAQQLGLWGECSPIPCN